eukprot:678141-Rhodomonas_salina.1
MSGTDELVLCSPELVLCSPELVLWPGLTPSRSPQGFSRQGAATPRDQRGTCLLYTSDAADDM